MAQRSKLCEANSEQTILGTARGGEAEDVGSSSLFTPTILSIHKGFAYEYSIFLLKKSFFIGRRLFGSATFSVLLCRYAFR